MTFEGKKHSTAIDRRTFLRWMPRQVFAGVKSLMSDEASSEIAEFPSKISTRSRAIAVIDIPQCLAWGASPCQACYLRCPLRDEAIVLDDGRPLIMASVCDGCGVCVEACRTVNDVGAIHIVNV